MTWLRFLELGLSLSVQVALMVVVCQGLGRCVNTRGLCRLWTTCHVLTLLLTVAALALPHPRFISPPRGLATPLLVGLVTLGTLLGQALFHVWLAGAGGMLFLTVWGMVRTSRFIQTCQPVDPTVLRLSDLDLTDGACGDGLHGPPEASATTTVQLLSSRSISSPFCWQFHRPCIVLPEYLLTFDRGQLRFVVRHEQEHLRTGHPLQLFLQRCGEIVFWFHPLVWWASRQVMVSREYACDAAAINSPTEVARYLRTLLAIVERGAPHGDGAIQPLAFLGTRSMIASRTKRLLELARGTAGRPQPRLSNRVASASLVLLAVLAMTIWLPVDVRASSRSRWSPWPTWTARVLHDFGIHARDFEGEEANDEVQDFRDGGIEDDDDLPPREVSQRGGWSALEPAHQ